MVNGRQTHGSRPWQGLDPIVIAAQIVNGLQTVVSRQLDITRNPAVVSVGAIKGGVRNNIIPDSVEMIGTIRTFDARAVRPGHAGHEAHGGEHRGGERHHRDVHARSVPQPGDLQRPGAHRARAAQPAQGRPATTNVQEIPLITGAEDFAYFAQAVPSVFFMVGVTPKGTDVTTAPANHSPLFYLDEAALPLATRALLQVVVDYLGLLQPHDDPLAVADTVPASLCASRQRRGVDVRHEAGEGRPRGSPSPLTGPRRDEGVDPGLPDCQRLLAMDRSDVLPPRSMLLHRPELRAAPGRGELRRGKELRAVEWTSTGCR